jgi:hypothetical protein
MVVKAEREQWSPKYASTGQFGSQLRELFRANHRMRHVMNKQIYAAVIIAAVAGAPFAAFAEGPRVSSYHDWPGMMQDAAPASFPSVSPFEGPRPSSLNNWRNMSQQSAAEAVSSADPARQGSRASGH